jgi:hypothetical protein
VRAAITALARDRDRGFTFDAVYCVLDVESTGQRAGIQKARRLAEQNRIVLVLSNPCCEVWLLAHFERTAASFNDCSDVISRLNHHWKQLLKREYQKGDEGVYEALAGWLNEALRNAVDVREGHFRDVKDTVDCNSSTEVHRLMGVLGLAEE